MSEEKPDPKVPRSYREGYEEPILTFHDEVEPIDMWDDILADGRPKHRTVGEAIEASKRAREERGNDE